MATKHSLTNPRVERIELMSTTTHGWVMSSEQETPTLNFGWAGERMDDIPEAARPKQYRRAALALIPEEMCDG